MMDAAVYDIPSRRLLFRAPGTSQIKGSATPVNLSEKLRRDSELGLQLAATNLVVNLHEQLGSFQRRVKAAPEEFKIVKRPGYTGGACLGLFHVLLLAGVGGLSVWFRWSGRA
jgi:rhombotail lipoprotein